MPIERNTVVARVENSISTPIDDDLVILNLAKNNYLGLDDVGRRIWELLETPGTVEALCDRLAREFDATPEVIVEDVLPFLAEMEREGLVHVVEK